MNKTINTFFRGLVVILPLSITIYILVKVFLFIDGFLTGFLSSLLKVRIVGIGFFATIFFIYFIGFLSQYITGEKFFKWIDMIVLKTPVAHKLYKMIKDIVSSLFDGNKKSNYKCPVLIEYPKKGLMSIGFVTNENVFYNECRHISVFVPTTPNPTSGVLVFVREDELSERLTYLSISTEEAMKRIMTLGIVSS